MKRSEFLEFVLHDAMRTIRDVEARAMFGGYGLYKKGVVFAIMVDDELYFKTDDKNRADFERAGSEPFTYETKKGKKVVMSYWRLPAEILEDSEQLPEWVDASLAASQRAAKIKKGRS